MIWQKTIGDAFHRAFRGRTSSKTWDLANEIKEIAKEKGCTSAQLALAWVLAQGKDIVPIPGTKRTSYLEENIKALQLRLTQEDLRRIDEVAPKGVAAGGRYPEPGMRLVNV